MASQTITTDLNWDSRAISGLANGDGVTINGATLTQNSDSRFSFQGAVIPGVTTDNTNGGRFLLDGTTVWWLPYSDGAGTIPARKAIDDSPVMVSQAATGATGELLAVFSELGVRETAPGGPLPATGFLKLRSKSGSFDASAIAFSGCTATAGGPGQRGWLQAVFMESNFAAISASGRWQATGDWFELGTTNGSRGQSFRYYIDDYCPAIWVETAPGSGSYEVWSDCGTLRWESATVTIPTDSRGKFFSCLVAGGTSTIRIAGSNCGTLPPAGCKVRVPNLHISAAPTADLSLNAAPNNTLGNRWTWSNTTGPVLLSHCNFGSVKLSFSQLWRVELANCGWYNNLYFDRISSPIVVSNCGNGLRDGGASSNLILELANNQVGGSFSGCKFTRWSLSDNNNVVSLTGCSNFTFTDCEFRFHTLSESNAAQRNATWANPFNLSAVFDTSFTNLKILGGPIGVFGGCGGISFTNLAYGDRMIGATDSSQAVNALRCENGSGLSVDGFRWYDDLANVNCGDSICRFKLLSGVTIKNIGSPAAPLTMGTSYGANAVVSTLGGVNGATYKRIYVSNTRDKPINGYRGADFGVISENVWGDAGDTAWISSGDVIVRGAYGTRPVTAGSIPDVTPFGNHLLDGFDSATTGWQAVLATNRTGDPFSAATIEVVAGSPAMNAFGWFFRSPTDELVIAWPWRVRGHTGFANSAPLLSQYNVLNYSFDVDTGADYSGTWTALTQANLAAISGIDPATGFLFKLRIKGPSSGNATFRGACFSTTTTATAQQMQYPDELVTLTINGLQLGTEVRIMDADLNVLGGVESAASGSFSAQITPQVVTVAIHALAYQTLRYEQLAVLEDTTLLVQQQLDRQYANPTS